MVLKKRNEKKRVVWLSVLVVGILGVVLVSPGGCKKADLGIELSPFVRMAQTADCADISGRLFLIDGDTVLYDRVGDCPDNGYGTTLFGETIDQRLAEYNDSIAGPVKVIHNETYRSMFDTILANLDQSDLGLGSGHTVREVSF